MTGLHDLQRLLGVAAGMAAGLSLVLTIALASYNYTGLTLLATLELFIATFWLSCLIIFGIIGPLLASSLLYYPFGMNRKSLFRHLFPYYISGTLAILYIWTLWQHSGLFRPWETPLLHITYGGVLQLIVIALILVAFLLFVRVNIAHRSSKYIVYSFLWIVSLTVLYGVVTHQSLVVYRKYEVVELARAAEAPVDGTEDRKLPNEKNADDRPRLVVVAIDGLSWHAIKPLVERDYLPAIRAVMRRGVIAYLDNHGDSASPRIWNTIFTGHAVEDHDIQGFFKVRLSMSGFDLKNFVSLPPAEEPLLGIGGLLSRAPSMGMWEKLPYSTVDRRVKYLWDLASDAGLGVVVANVYGIPVAPEPMYEVNGVIVSYEDDVVDNRTVPKGILSTWEPPAVKDWMSVKEVGRRLRAEAEKTVELGRQVDADLIVYYTWRLDTLSHELWDFYSRERFMIRDLPTTLSEREWEELVSTNAAAPLFRAYREIDSVLGIFLESFPSANFLIVSDHGWTFTPQEHWSAPGVFILAGTDIVAGREIDSVAVEDVTPVAMHLLRLPLSKEWPGNAVSVAATRLAAPGFVSQYERFSVRTGDSMEKFDAEMLQKLRALGYVQ